jgi:hypothetical protein
MSGFTAVRALQGVELEAGRTRGFTLAQAAALSDATTSNSVGATILVMFLGAALIGMPLLAIALWRAGMPKVAVVAVGAFQLLDLALPGRIGSIASHVVLTIALAFVARRLVGARRAPARHPTPDVIGVGRPGDQVV